MRLYKISRTPPFGWGTYIGAVVAVHDEEKARNMHPNGDVWISNGYYVYPDTNEYSNSIDTWIKPKNVIVKYIGEASENIKIPCVILSSRYDS